MPTWNFVRDSLIVAAIVILLALAVALTLNLISTLFFPGIGDRAILNPVVIAVLYLVAFGLIFVLRKSHDRPSGA